MFVLLQFREDFLEDQEPSMANRLPYITYERHDQLGSCGTMRLS